MKVFLALLPLFSLSLSAPAPEPPLFGGSGGGFGGGFGGGGSLGGSYSAPPSNSYAPPSGGYPAPQQPVYGAPAQQPVVHKHVYVHVPPPEPEYQAPRRPIQVAAPQKHYKIVFIKAPTPPTPTAPVIPVQPQDEQKTLIYVLVKKPEEAPEINIPTPAPTQPSKPEVYFIRYKTQKQETGGYPDSGVPQNQYGPPAQPPSGEYGAPSGGSNGY